MKNWETVEAVEKFDTAVPLCYHLPHETKPCDSSRRSRYPDYPSGEPRCLNHLLQ